MDQQNQSNFLTRIPAITKNTENSNISNNNETLLLQKLQTPELPPVKPQNELHFYIDENQEILLKRFPNLSISDINHQLRNEWQTLNINEKLEWITKYKFAKKKFNVLLSKYQSSHLHFDAIAHYSQKQHSKKRSKPDNEHFDSDSSNEKQVIPHKRRKTSVRNQSHKVHSPQSKSAAMIFDQVLSDISASGKKRRYKGQTSYIINNDHMQILQQFVLDMKHAARKDWSANRQKQPCIHMLQLLNRVIEELNKKTLYASMLNHCNILDVIRDWIHPLPDGSLPPLKIRTEMYRIIDKFQLHTNDDMHNFFQRSDEKTREYNNSVEDEDYDIYEDDVYHRRRGNKFRVRSFPKTMMHLWAHKKETPENKQILRKIMEQWIRSLTETNLTYDEVRDEQFDQQQENLEIVERNRILRAQQIHNNRNNDYYCNDGSPKNNKRARIPKRTWNDFVIRPESKIHLRAGGSSASGRRRSSFNDKLKNVSKKRSGGKQASKPSVTGR